MELLFQRFADQITSQIVGTVKNGLSPVGPYLKRLSIGVSLVVVSSVLWFTTLIFILLSVFITLAHLEAYINPALWTSLVSGLCAVVLTGIGSSLLRKPR